MKKATQHRIRLGGRRIDYQIVRSRTATQLRVRVGPSVVEVVQPVTRDRKEVEKFLVTNERWILDHIDRAAGLRSIRHTVRQPIGEIPYRGNPTPVRVEAIQSRATGNVVQFSDGEIIVWQGPNSRTPVTRSLELWLRREARRAIEGHLEVVTARVGQRPKHIYVMDQRTKWGNCSTRKNLSFNWRLILAPDYVFQYLVTHETVHLVVADHSAKFWLTVQSFCPKTERARQWLSSHGSDLMIDLKLACPDCE